MNPNSQWVEGVYIGEYKARILPFVDDTIGRIIAKPITPKEGVEIAAKLKEYCQAHAAEQLKRFASDLSYELLCKALDAAELEQAAPSSITWSRDDLQPIIDQLLKKYLEGGK